MSTLKWGHVPVSTTIWPEQSPEHRERFLREVEEGLGQAVARVPDAMAMIPATGFGIIVWWKSGDIFVVILESELYRQATLPGHYARGDALLNETHIALAARHHDAAPETGNIYGRLLTEMAGSLQTAWPVWLAWRKRLRRPKPEWLVELAAKKRVEEAFGGENEKPLRSPRREAFPL